MTNDKEEILEILPKKSDMQYNGLCGQPLRTSLRDRNVRNSAISDSAEALSQRVVTESELGTFIHQTRAWQALHLQLISPILADAKRCIAKALKENFIVIKRRDNKNAISDRLGEK